MQFYYKSYKASLVILCLILVACLFPVCPGETQALEDEEAEETEILEIPEEVSTVESAMLASDDGITAYADNGATSSVAIAIQNAVNVDVNPTAEGAFSSSTAELIVKTIYTDDYIIFLETKDGSTALKPRSEHNWASIVTVPEAVTASEFPMNTWGYNLQLANTTSEQLFSPVLGRQTEVAQREVANAGTQVDKWQLSFGTKLGTVIPADTYSNQVIVTVVARPVVPFPSTLTTMQGMTPEICAETTVGQTTVLKDTRDNNSYTVAKLKDGNCWMTQNLALKLTTAGLKAADSDITADWNSSSTYKPTATYTSITSANTKDMNNDAVHSWNNGNGYGTYYTFNAVMAGKGMTATGDQESIENSSVCPKGWKIPLAGSNYNDTKGSFQYLAARYKPETNETTNLSSIMRSEPMNFVYGGYIIISSAGGYLRFPETNGFLWSSVSNKGLWSYGFDIAVNQVQTSRYIEFDYYAGILARCLAR